MPVKQNRTIKSSTPEIPDQSLWFSTSGMDYNNSRSTNTADKKVHTVKTPTSLGKLKATLSEIASNPDKQPCTFTYLRPGEKGNSESFNHFIQFIVQTKKDGELQVGVMDPSGHPIKENEYNALKDALKGTDEHSLNYINKNGKLEKIEQVAVEATKKIIDEDGNKKLITQTKKSLAGKTNSPLMAPQAKGDHNNCGPICAEFGYRFAHEKPWKMDFGIFGTEEYTDEMDELRRKHHQYSPEQEENKAKLVSKSQATDPPIGWNAMFIEFTSSIAGNSAGLTAAALVNTAEGAAQIAFSQNQRQNQKRQAESEPEARSSAKVLKEDKAKSPATYRQDKENILSNNSVMHR